MYPRRRYPDPFYARSPFAVIAAGTGHAEGLTGHALARINTQRYCYVVTFVNRVNGIKSLFLSLMSEDIRKEPWMLVFPALTTLLYEEWLPTGSWFAVSSTI